MSAVEPVLFGHSVPIVWSYSWPRDGGTDIPEFSYFSAVAHAGPIYLECVSRCPSMGSAPPALQHWVEGIALSAFPLGGGSYLGCVRELSISMGTSRCSFVHLLKLLHVYVLSPKVTAECLPTSLQEECGDLRGCHTCLAPPWKNRRHSRQTEPASPLPQPPVGLSPDSSWVGAGIGLPWPLSLWSGMWGHNRAEYLLPMVAMKQHLEDINAENDILGRWPRSWPVSVSKPSHKLK